jgi:ATP-dependent RNA helicase DeaD
MSTPPTDTTDTSDSAQATATPPEAASEEDEAQRAFAALGLGPESLRAIAELGYSTPTPIQEQTIPALLAGEDVIAQAPTGTGKTAAYGFPLVEHLEPDVLHPQALVVLPTRELAIQVAEALHGMGRFREAVTLPIYGGAPYERQLRALARGVQFVVGTPGRLLDHLNRGTLKLDGIRTVVLDEADEMLSMGFIEDIEAILAAMPQERQTALFSATIPPRIARLAEQYMRAPRRVAVAAREAVAPRVRQVYYEVPFAAKLDALTRILDLEEPESAIVFVRTRRDADEVAERLNGAGYLAQAIHGEINQAQRERVLGRFRAGNTQLLVATDVAARGLDIPDVSHIINYDLPLDAESYVHRIGRTGRAGRAGEALTMVTPRERRMLIQIEHAIHRRLERLRLPTPADVAARRRAAFREDVLEILDAGQLDPYLALVEDLADTHEPAELAAAAFKLAAQAREAARPGRGFSWIEAPEQSEQVAPERGAAAEGEDGDRKGRAGRPGREHSEERDQGFHGPRGRRERAARPAGETTRLFLRVGKRDGVRPADLVGAIANEAGVPGDQIGDIDLYDTFAFVDVPADAAETVLAALNGTTIRNRPPRATIALPSGDWGDGQARDTHDGGDGRDARDAVHPRDTVRPRGGFRGRGGFQGREGRDRRDDFERGEAPLSRPPRDDFRGDYRPPMRAPFGGRRGAPTGRKGGSGTFSSFGPRGPRAERGERRSGPRDSG